MAKSRNLLKEAIAEADMIKELATESARLSMLEEFRPKIASMVSKKLSEMEDSSNDGYGADEGGETDTAAVTEQSDLTSSGVGTGDNKQPAAGTKSSSKIINPDQETTELGEVVDGAVADGDGHEKVVDKLTEDDGDFDLDDDDEDEDEDDMSFTSDDGEFGGDDEMSFGAEDEFGGEDEFGAEDGEEGEIDIEALVRELEAELYGDKGAPTKDVGIEEDETELAARDNVVQTISDPAAAPAGQKTITIQLSEEEEIDEILREMESGTEDRAMDGTKYARVTEGLTSQIVKLKKNLKEHRDVIRYLKDRISETNMLNTKLLFTNKLFKKYSLTNEQKLHIVEAFDRAATVREAKLVFTTLVESYNGKKNKKMSKAVKTVTESFASSTVGTTKPKDMPKTLVETDLTVARLQRLAGIIKN